MTAALPDPALSLDAVDLPAGVELGAIAEAAGLRRIHILAWRDLDDPEAGGSEVHAAAIATIWAAAGVDVTLRTSTATGHPAYARRDGYRVIRKAGRYGVFPRSALSGLVGRTGQRDGLVEIWNGMPFFSPLWARQPSIVFLHHVHAEMWRMALKPAALARSSRSRSRRRKRSSSSSVFRQPTSTSSRRASAHSSRPAAPEPIIRS
jgi:hypothetical protein